MAMKILSTSNAHPVQITALAAETCYNTIGNHYMKEHEYVSKIIKSGHTSVMEHWWVTFMVDDEDVIKHACAFAEMVAIPGVILLTHETGMYVSINWRHIQEHYDNRFINEITNMTEYFSAVRLI
jgi:hypothetical protein